MSAREWPDKVNDIRLTEHFRLREFECPCCRCVQVSPALLHGLEELRGLWGKPVIITSGYRCAENNLWVKGVPNSLHMRGRAADIVVPEAEQDAVAAMARKAGFDSVILYGKRNFIHLGVS